jgi:hypothetical protein
MKLRPRDTRTRYKRAVSLIAGMEPEPEHVVRRRLDEYAACVALATEYQRKNRESGHGLRVPLTKGEVFWSHGWYNCERCHGAPDDWNARMVERISVQDGVVTRGWYCR